MIEWVDLGFLCGSLVLPDFVLIFLFESDPLSRDIGIDDLIIGWLFLSVPHSN